MRLVPLFLLAACATTARAPMPLAEVFERPGGALPFRFAFSPDGTRLAYLKTRDGEGIADLWALDLATMRHTRLLAAEGPGTLTAEERSARERRRDRTRGISRFWWRPDGKSILLALSGDLYELRDGQLVQLTETPAPERDPRWSPDGTSIAYVRDRNLYVRRGAEEIALTTAGGGTVTCGLAEFIAGEELGRHRGFWWAPDSARLAYVEFDEKDVPVFSIHNYLPPYGETVEQRYPRAGDTNVTWKLEVVPAAGGPSTTIDVPGEYLVRVDWTEHGLYVQTSDRAERELTLWRCDPETGAAQSVLVEKDDAWVRFHKDFRMLPDGRFLWSSESSGERRLYVFEDGALRPVAGSEGLQGVVAVDGDDVYITALKPDPTKRLFGCVSLAGDGWHSADFPLGWHNATASPDGKWFVDTWSQVGVPPVVHLRGPGGNLTILAGLENPLPYLPQTEFLTIPADDGTELHAMLMRPRRTGPGPAIVHCYGGPGAHLVADRWGGATYLWHARMVARGYTVLVVDSRGAGGYGRAFSRIVSGRLCDWEVRDQAAAARWLGRQPYVEAGHVGIWGWSYGGTLSLMCLLNAPDAFAAAVAVAPVTDWRDYDTAYTERYLGLPSKNREGYDLSSPITFADKLERPLFLAHGFMDDNVHFRGSVAFVDRAQRAGKIVEVDFYPRGAHGIGGKRERTVLFQRMERFWDRTLR